MKKYLVVLFLFVVNFFCLEDDIKVVNEFNVDWFYVDIMDGYFVFNIFFGFMIVEVIKRKVECFLDVYLMIS